MQSFYYNFKSYIVEILKRQVPRPKQHSHWNNNVKSSIVEIFERTIAGPESTLPVKVPIKSNIKNILERAIAAPESTYHPNQQFNKENYDLLIVKICKKWWRKI